MRRSIASGSIFAAGIGEAIALLELRRPICIEPFQRRRCLHQIAMIASLPFLDVTVNFTYLVGCKKVVTSIALRKYDLTLSE